MNNEYEERYFKVFYHFEKVPRFMRKHMREEFMKHRNEVARIFREHIKVVNDEWTVTGKSLRSENILKILTLNIVSSYMIVFNLL